ncbi:hypothetical protein HTZ77_41900 [Nonomuraea sp. SMC257]|uniref:Uncharacterized protein n=1 Tax=Nonomuraea montanisoli TaxID=2741721 RepID=A0A7Y6M7W0_9ACTN|nr:hypothetical protein [Nonomuraea montanisoli]NUW37907.1 hypothetical protein [Nonomuraea montanisoli]
MSLEKRYRRLLAWYPKRHRATYEEEMVAVLLAGSAPGRRWPGVRDTCDLLRGGLAVWLRHAGGAESRRHWHEAFAIATVVAPIVLLVVETGPALAYVLRTLMIPVLVPEPALRTLAMALPYGVVAVSAWLGRRTAAAVLAWGWTVLYAWLVSSPFGPVPAVRMVRDGALLVGGGGTTAVQLALPTALLAMTLTLAPWSPRPGAGRTGTPVRPPGPGVGRLAGWSAAALAAEVASAWTFSPWARALPLLVPLAAVAVSARSAVGRRAAFILLPFMGVAMAWPRWGAEPSDLAALAALSAAAVAVPAVVARLAGTRGAASGPASA